MRSLQHAIYDRAHLYELHMKWNALQRCDRPATRNRGSPRLVHSCTALAPLPRPLRDCADEYSHPTRPRSSLCGSAANGRCAPAAASQAHKMLWRITTPCSPPCMSASTSADPYARGYPALPNHTSYVHAPAWACRALHASARTPARPHEDARTRTGADALLCLSTQSQAVHAKALEDSHHPQRPAQHSSAQLSTAQLPRLCDCRRPSGSALCTTASQGLSLPART